jgi:hypothetical protein
MKALQSLSPLQIGGAIVGLIAAAGVSYFALTPHIPVGAPLPSASGVATSASEVSAAVTYIDEQAKATWKKFQEACAADPPALDGADAIAYYEAMINTLDRQFADIESGDPGTSYGGEACSEPCTRPGQTVQQDYCGRNALANPLEPGTGIYDPPFSGHSLQPLAPAQAYKYTSAFRDYLVDGDRDALVHSIERIGPSGPDLSRTSGFGETVPLVQAGEPVSGILEYLQLMFDGGEGFYGYHIEHLKTHLAYIQKYGTQNPTAGQSLADGIAEWKKLNDQIQTLIPGLLAADRAAAPSGTSFLGRPNVSAAWLEVHKRLAEILAISSRRVEGITFVPHEIVPAPPTVAVFVVDDKLPAKPPSRYQMVFKALAQAGSEPKKKRTLFVIGPALEKADPSQLTFASTSPGIEYKLLETKTQRRAKYGSTAYLDEWQRGWTAACDRFTSSDARQKCQGLEAMLVEADLNGTVGGIKDFDIHNGAKTLPATWILDRGDIKASLSFVRPRYPPDTPNVGLTHEYFFQTDIAFQPEKIRIQIRTESDPRLESIDLTLAKNDTFIQVAGEPMIKARRVPGTTTEYLSAPIMVHAGGDKLGQTPADAIDILSQSGELLQAKIADDGLLANSPAVIQATILRAPQTPWIEALKRAGSNDRVAGWQSFLSRLNGARPLTADEVGEVSNTPLRGDSGAGATKIRLGDLAAMLILKDAFVESMGQYAKQLDAFQDSEIDGLRSELQPHFEDLTFKFGDIAIDGPKGVGKIPVRYIYKEAYLSRMFQLDSRWQGSAAADQWRKAAFAQAFAQYREAVKSALKSASEIKDDDYAGLLQLTGNGFDPIVQAVLPNLVRLDEIGPMDLEWVSDSVARQWVSSIGALAKASTATREYNQALTATVGLVFSLPALVPGGIYGVATSAALNLTAMGEVALDKFPESFRSRAEVKFAVGSLEVLSSERIDAARLNERSTWGTVAAFAFAGIGVGADVLRAATEARAAIALSQAFRARQEAQTGALAMFDQQNPTARAFIVRAIEEANDAQSAGRALTAEEEAALALQRDLDQQAELAFRNGRTAGIEFDPNGPTNRLGEAFEPAEALKIVNAAKALEGLPQAGKPIQVILESGAQIEYHLGKVIGQGGFATVYEMLDKDGNALPYVMKFYRDMGDVRAADVVRATEEGQNLLREGTQIRQLDIVAFEARAKVAVKPGSFEPLPFIIQQRLDPTMKTFSASWTQNKVNKILVDIKLNGVLGGKFTEPYQRAVVKLYRQLADKGLIWEDGHLDNIYFVGEGDAVEAGILDQDRIMKLDQATKDAYMEYWLGKMEATPKSPLWLISSLEKSAIGGNGAKFTPDMLMAKMFEYRRRWIRFDRATQRFEPVLIDPGIVKEYFPDLYKNVDFDFTKPALVPPKPRAPSGVNPYGMRSRVLLLAA